MRNKSLVYCVRKMYRIVNILTCVLFVIYMSSCKSTKEIRLCNATVNRVECNGAYFNIVSSSCIDDLKASCQASQGYNRLVDYFGVQI